MGAPGKREHGTSLPNRSQRGRFWGIPALAAVLLMGPVLAEETGSRKEEHTENPHGDPKQCASCHTSAAGRGDLRFDGDVSQLCRSCHDGRLAGVEGHPADLAPSPAIAKRIPSDLPIEKGLLTCLSCHDVASRCKAGQTAALPNRNFLRGTQAGTPLSFCFRCHIQEKYRPFNAHDQLEAGKVKTDICVWCHLSAPDVRSPPREDASYALRSKSHAVCSNCHPVGKGHPTSGSHMYSTPSSEMMWYMSAYEMQFQMRLPFEQLLKYVRAAKRAPRTIPLDENGGITCYSCHNPHEKDLLPSWNLRSVGAESKHALSGRLRARGGNVCIVCHKE